ncbi:YadA-like family protein [Paraburkholderia sp. J76]|uniref:YadA-like family protein n=1 Tax=Paraburkholderia sp. J76 TaxID=2805439 RepID=UPI002ABD97F5|nr:YadA-like family protein [Paraburkholderia sp. J76]
MNKTYRSVWNETTGTWNAVQENASGRKKAKRLTGKSLCLAALGTLGVLTTDAAHASTALAYVGYEYNGVDYCVKAGYTSYIKGCQMWGSSVTNFTGNNIAYLSGSVGPDHGGVWAADWNAGLWYGAAPSNTTLSGSSSLYVDSSGVTARGGAINLFSLYGVNVGGTKILNVAPGTISSNSMDAVNGSQLYNLGASVAKDLGGGVSVSNNGAVTTPKYVISGGTYSDVGSALNALSAGATRDAVLYDSSAHNAVTLGGAGSSTPVALKNVAAGAVNASSTDAVNGAQLYGVNASVTNISNDITQIHNTLTTAGWGAQAASTNPGAYPMGGFIADADGKVSNPAVLYVPNSTGTANAQIVLDPGSGNSPYFVNGDRTQGRLPKGTVISNVANGIQDTDAATVGQVYDIVAQQSGNGPQGATPQMMLKAGAMLAAAPAASGVNFANANGAAYKTAAYYSQVRGAANSTGSTPPTDVARANGAGTVAIGSNAQADGGGAATLGIQSLATGNDSVALGAGSVANKDNTVSVGSDGTSQRVVINPDNTTTTVQSQLNTRRIVNMAAGQDDTDAVNVAQLRGVTGALGGGAAINADGSFTAPVYHMQGGTQTTVGDALGVLDSSVSALQASGMQPAQPVVIGGKQMGSINEAISNLDGRITQNTTDIAALKDTGAAATTVAPTDAAALHYDSSTHDAVTLGGSGATSTVAITNLQNAALTANSTDAVSGQQLYATNEQLASLNQAVQNISTSGSTGVATNSTHAAAVATGTQTVALGGGAVAAGASSTALGDSASAKANNAVALGANSVADRDNTVSVGAAGSERQIVNVAAGTQGTDAVNVNQLNNAVSQGQQYTDQRIADVQGQINTVSKNAYAGVAAAMAMPNLTPSGPGRTVVAAGGGYYKGESAAAVGVTYRSPSMHWLMNGAVSVTSTGDTGVRAQVGYEF